MVAALTLPVLVGKYQKAVIISSLKKNYAALSSAVNSATGKYGEPLYWNGFTVWMNSTLCEQNLCDKFVNQFVESVNTLKIYPAQHVSANEKFNFCGSTIAYKTLTDDSRTVASGSGDARQNYSSVLLPDGSCWLFYFKGAGMELSSSVMQILVDVNGPGKMPNRYGADTFRFELYGNGKLEPLKLDDCRKSFNNNGMGQGCAYKIIKDGWQIKNDYYWHW